MEFQGHDMPSFQSNFTSLRALELDSTQAQRQVAELHASSLHYELDAQQDHFPDSSRALEEPAQTEGLVSPLDDPVSRRPFRRSWRESQQVSQSTGYSFDTLPSMSVSTPSRNPSELQGSSVFDQVLMFSDSFDQNVIAPVADLDLAGTSPLIESTKSKRPGLTVETSYLSVPRITDGPFTDSPIEEDLDIGRPALIQENGYLAHHELALAAGVNEGYAEKGQSQRKESEPTTLSYLSPDEFQAFKPDTILSSRQSDIVAPSEQDSEILRHQIQGAFQHLIYRFEYRLYTSPGDIQLVSAWFELSAVASLDMAFFAAKALYEPESVCDLYQMVLLSFLTCAITLVIAPVECMEQDIEELSHEAMRWDTGIISPDKQETYHKLVDLIWWSLRDAWSLGTFPKTAFSRQQVSWPTVLVSRKEHTGLLPPPNMTRVCQVGIDREYRTPMISNEHP
jgi:hypothetical protein